MTEPEGCSEPEGLAAERDAWNAVADAWRRWWPVFEASAQPLNDRLVELAGARPGAVVLDVATGIGEPALTAARAVGPSGRIVATDLASRMLELARERAASAGLDNVEFVLQGGEQLALDESFDAALSRWGLMLMVDPAGAARRVHAALKPGGRIAAAVWSTPESVPFLAIPGAAIRRALQLPDPDPDAPGPFRLCRAGQLVELLAEAGFDGLREESLDVTLSFASAGEFVRFVRDLSSSARKLIDPLPRERQAEVEAAIAAAIRPHEVTPGGSITLNNRVVCAAGARPA